MNSNNITSAIIESMRPINRNVLVQVFDERAKTISGIELPVTENNAFIPDRGIVYHGGSSDFVKGQKVVVEKYQGIKYLTEKDESFLLIDSSSIIGVLDDDADVTIRQKY